MHLADEPGGVGTDGFDQVGRLAGNLPGGNLKGDKATRVVAGEAVPRLDLPLSPRVVTSTRKMMLPGADGRHHLKRGPEGAT